MRGTAEAEMAKTHHKNRKAAKRAKTEALRSKIGVGLDADWPWYDHAKWTRVQKSGAGALEAWKSEKQEQQMSSLNWTDEPPCPSWDLARPWWIAQGSKMIMGVAFNGHGGPGWEAVQKAASEICSASARAQGSLASINFNLHKQSPEDAWSGGRMTREHPSYGAAGLFDVLEGPYRKSFSAPNGRRERRRSGKAAPEAWRREFGWAAEAIWSAGIAPRWPIKPGFDADFEEASALIQALVKCGAIKAGLCRDFYKMHSEELGIWNMDRLCMRREAWESFELSMRDSMRQKWALEAASGNTVPSEQQQQQQQQEAGEAPEQQKTVTEKATRFRI